MHPLQLLEWTDVVSLSLFRRVTLKVRQLWDGEEERREKGDYEKGVEEEGKRRSDIASPLSSFFFPIYDPSLFVLRSRRVSGVQSDSFLKLQLQRPDRGIKKLTSFLRRLKMLAGINAMFFFPSQNCPSFFLLTSTPYFPLFNFSPPSLLHL